jgi:LmbE family N-acetylglucosaminyl deacetylase
MSEKVDNPAEPKCLLVCLAHPDDETFGMGGTLALYSRRGVKVHLVCGTRGEVGE